MLRRARSLSILALTLLCSAPWAACSQPRPAAPTRAFAPQPTADPWPAGEVLFKRDPAWVGADGAYSIQLDSRRVLWLFGDTFIDPAADGLRENGPNYFVRNSVAIQRSDRDGAFDASRDEMKFYWGPMANGAPSSFFHDIYEDQSWLWPLSGVRLASGPLLLFRMHIHRTDVDLGFKEVGWDAIAVDQPELEPSAWTWRIVQPLTTDSPGVLLGCVLVHDGWLYAYAGSGGSDSYLARWSLTALGRVPAGALARPEWYLRDGRFGALPKGSRPAPLFEGAQSEFSVHYDRARERFVEIQMRGVLLADPATSVAYRTAPRPWGPWSDAERLWAPLEAKRPNARDLVAYAAKAHPEQDGGSGLLVSYVVNDLHAELPGDAIYYPRLLRVQLP